MRENDRMIAVYSRKSRFTGKGESIGNQIELCRTYIRNLYGPEDAERIMVYEDEGFSGGNLNRPGFREMMDHVRRGEYRAIIVYRLDRISRNISDFAALIDELTKLEVAFISIREQFDTSTPMGRAMMFIISVFSQLERETIAERIRDNMRELAKTGRWLGGNTPTGFASQSVSSVTLDGKARKACSLKLIPEEAEMVRTIFDLYIQLDSLTAVEAELLRRGIRTKRGNDFTRFSIKGILQNPVYMTADETAFRYFADRNVEVYSDPSAFDGTRGIMAYNRTDQEKGKATVFLPMEDWTIAVGRHPGLIPSAQWCSIQQSLERNRSGAYRSPRRNEALLTGLLYCACGERMYPKLTRRINSDGEPIFAYVCKMKERSKGQRCSRRNISGNTLDAAVLAQIRTVPRDEKTFIDILEKGRREIAGSRESEDTQLRALRKELSDNQKKMEGLLDSVGLLGATAAGPYIVSRIEALDAANREIGQRILKLEEKTAANVPGTEEISRLCGKLSDMDSLVGEMTVEERRTAVRTMIAQVIWDGENGHVYFAGAEGTA